MVTRKALALSLSLIACSVQAANNICSLTSASADKVVKVKGVPGFFFKVHPSGDYVSFIELYHNTLVDMNSGIEYPMVGTLDPVWSPDGKFLTSPGEFDSGRGLEFYESDQVLLGAKKGTSASVKANPSGMEGVYQSIGKTGKNDYTVITDTGGVLIQKFKVESAFPEPQGEAFTPCENIDDFPTDLPMLSKDGRFLSVYDKSGSTKIYRFKGENCELALDLGFATGKVSFNLDSSQIAFHVDEFSDFQYGYFSGISQDKVKNVMVMKLDETKDGKLVPSSWALASHDVKPGDGGYYPDFDAKGNVYYLEDVDNNFQFVKVSQENLEFKPMQENLLFGKSDCSNCSSDKKEKSSTEILANLWMKICSQENDLPMSGHLEFTMAMEPDGCRDMVKKFWVKSLGISKEELLKACPTRKPKKPEVLGNWDPKQKATGENLVKTKCLYCHTQPRHYEVEESLTVWTGPDDSRQEEVTIKKTVPALQLDQLDYTATREMLQAIQGGGMPKGGALSEKDKVVMMDYLQRRLLDFPPKKTRNFLRVRHYTDEYLEAKRQRARNENEGEPQEVIDRAVNYMNCRYGQDCAQHLADKRKELKEAGESEKKTFDTLMDIKCENLFEVTIEECRKWDAER